MDEEAAGMDYIRYNRLEKATKNFIEITGNYDGNLLARLNKLQAVAVNGSKKVEMVGCGDALIAALHCGDEVAEKTAKLKIAAQAMINAISAYDDTHDFVDNSFDPHEHGANHGRAVGINELEAELDTYSRNTSKKKRLGIVESLKKAVNY